MELRATRYADEDNLSLQRAITDELPYFDYAEALAFYTTIVPLLERDRDFALLGCNDRYFLLTHLLGRKDLYHPWLYARTREVEAEPDGFLDLWAREHYKSTIITYAGAIQEVLVDPEICIGIFSFTQDVARTFVAQIKAEFERNDLLKQVYADVLWRDPKREAAAASASWTNEALTVRRASNPKEATIEGWGLVGGMPTGRHFPLRIYDDMVTDKSVTNEEQVRKTTEAWELSDNLGGGQNRRWHIGTRYSFADTYGYAFEQGILRPRLYPATDNGRADGKPVFFTPAKWADKKKAQATSLNAQMLQNPLAGKENTFRPEWLRSYAARPTTLNVYILGDPSKGKSARSDRTALAVIGIDSAGNKYLLDGYRHRMSLSERWTALRDLYKHWTRQQGVANVAVGYEQYGMQSDLEYFEERMQLEGFSFPIREVSWTREGNESKKARVERLQPDLEHSKFFLPALVWTPGLHETDPETRKVTGIAFGATWSIDPEKHSKVIRRLERPTKAMTEIAASGNAWRLARPIIRKDEKGRLYDLAVAFMDEVIFFPFGTHDDLVDAASRIYDMDPVPPAVHEIKKVEAAANQTFADA